MTDKPTPEQIQRACTMLSPCWSPEVYGRHGSNALTALADTIAKLDAMQAERDKARADLGEIYIQLDGVSGLHRLADDSRQAIEAAHDLAAPYRVETDPLVEALVAANARLCDSEEGYAPILRAELAKRGLEIGRQA